MPLLPLPVLRAIEGLLAIVCLGLAALGVVIVWMLVVGGMLEILGIQSPLLVAPLTVLFLALSIWFGFNAIRGESTTTEESERDRA